MALTTARVKKVLEQGVVKAGAMGLGVTVAVVDANGMQRGLLSMEGARFTTIGIGVGKALACAGVQRPTVDMVERAGRPVFQYQMIHEGFVFAQGGVPIMEGGEFVGACGISGGTNGEQDEEIAYAAVT